MKLSEPQARFLRFTDETNTWNHQGAYFELGPVKGFTTRTVTSLAKRGLITVGTDHYLGRNGGRTAVSDVWITFAGREALNNA